MNIDQVEALGHSLKQMGRDLERIAAEIGARLGSTSWLGPDSHRFRCEWWPKHKVILNSTANGIEHLGQAALDNADEQRRASDSGPAGAAAAGIASLRRPRGLKGGRQILLGALASTEGQIGRDEIKIIRLANGRYVVILPGVTDLTEGINRNPWSPVGVYSDWLAPNEYGSVRDMGNAMRTARNPGGRDAYADQVEAAMQAAGVPAGAEVMLVGHSYGGYAAMHLAADTEFNGPPVDTAYAVTVTDVVSFGASTQHYLEYVPASTNALVVAHALDAPYRAESLLDNPIERMVRGSALPDNHHSVEFVDNLYVATNGAGHAQSHYMNWLLEDSFDKAADPILKGIGDRYSDSGTPTYVSVPASGSPEIRRVR